MADFFTEKSNKEIEQSLIGCLFFDDKFFYETDLSADEFSDKNASDAWAEIGKTLELGKKIAVAIVAKSLTNGNGVNWINECISLANLAAFDQYTAEVKKRHLASLDNTSYAKAQGRLMDGEDPEDVFLEAIAEMEANRGDDVDRDKQRHLEIMEVVDKISRLMKGEEPISECHVRGLNKSTGGWVESTLTILAGRPGMGKTALAICEAVKMALEGTPVAIYSLEMSKKQFYARLISIICGIGVSEQRQTSVKLTPEQFERVQNAASFVYELPIYVITKYRTLEAIRRDMVRQKRKNDVGFFIIDYIQLINVKNHSGNREQEVSKISRNLKISASDSVLNSPILALSQLSRAVESRGGTKRPILSDLRESGSIEQDADNVLFAYRPEYYSILENEQGESLIGVAEVICAKAREGNTDTYKMHFDGRIGAFCNFNFDNKPEYPFLKFGAVKGNRVSETPDVLAQLPGVRIDDTDDVPF